MSDLVWCPRGRHFVPAVGFGRDSRRASGRNLWCRACRSAYRKQWQQANPASARASRRKYDKANRAKIRAYNRVYMDRLRVEVFTAYGSKCACCGEMRREFLTLDHIDGREGAHIGAPTLQVYLMVRKEGFPDRYRLLCWNCNLAHGLYGYCPHELEREEVA